MKSWNWKSGILPYWGLALILTGLVGGLIQVRAAHGAELKPIGMGPADAGDLDGREIPSAARTRQYEDKVIFRYLDEGFVSVAVAGSFNGWQPVPMALDPKSGAWSATIGMERGQHAYQFLVEARDERWEAIDPSNLLARKDAEHGWVSLVTVPEGDAGTAAETDSTAGNTGDELETRPQNKVVDIDLNLHQDREPDWDDREHWDSHRRRYVRREMNLLYPHLDDHGAIFSFQRVDGFSLALQPSAISREDFGPAVKGLFSYGFRSEEWTLGGALIQPLLENRRLLAVVRGHSGTDFQENTGVGGLENSLAGIFFREDFRDYYRREGIILSVVGYPASSLRLEAGFESSDYTSLESKETWSFADGDFAVNPAVDEGMLRCWFAKAMVGTRNNHVAATWESGRNRESDRFDYSLLKTAYRGRIHMSKARYLDFRTMYATGLSGELPVQRRFPVGGLGTVRGYYYQSLLTPDPRLATPSPAKGGQRMLVANFEYAFSFDTDIMWNPERWDDDWKGFDDWEHFEFDSAFFLFFDTGMAWEDRTTDIDLNDLKSSAGIGFQFDDGGPRFDIVKTLDAGGHDTLFQIRLERMF